VTRIPLSNSYQARVDLKNRATANTMTDLVASLPGARTGPQWSNG
jgi:hypothetical protein